MADLINNRVNEAQALLQVRADRLQRLLKSVNGKKTTKEFREGVEHVAKMIEGESKVIDTAVFDLPKTRLEQMRNLQLTTGGANTTPTQHLKPATDVMDMMLSTLEAMVR